MSTVTSGLIGALGGALFGALSGFLGTFVAQRYHQRRWETDALLRAMGYLAGGTQARNIGIGMIDGMLEREQIPRGMRASLALVLWNQLLYLCEDSKKRLIPDHERNNALRLVKLVEGIDKKKWFAGKKLGELYPGELDKLKGSIDRAKESSVEH